MRIAHVSDIHLSHRRYVATTASGRSQREQDVSDAWRACVDGIIAAKPDLVMIPGDVFDHGRPTNLALADGVRGILKLRQALPRVPVLVVPGNHDEKGISTGGASGSEYRGSPMSLLALAGATVAGEAKYLTIPSLDCTVLMVPDRDLRTTRLVPGPESGAHLLLAHGSIGGRLSKLPDADVLPAELISPDFLYCALGDYHCTEQVARNAWYSGSLEFTSSNPWGEIDRGPKGWLLVDTAAGTVQHQPVPTRRIIDLPRISAHEMTAADLTARILAQVATADVAGAVVRQVVTECLTATRKEIDARTIRKATASAVNFYLDTRVPEEYSAGSIAWELKDPLPEWFDDFNRDEPVEQSEDEFSLADAIMDALKSGGELPAIPVDLDPYGLDTPVPKMRARERAA